MSNPSYLINTVTKVIAFLLGVKKTLTFIALVFLIGSFGWLVFGRYILNVTPTWVEQLALLLIVYITFLGAAVGVQEDTHLGVTVFRDLLGKKLQLAIRFIADVIVATLGFLLFLSSLELIQFGWDTLLPILNIPESFRTLAVAIGGAGITLFAGFRAIQLFLELTGTEKKTSGGDS